MNSHLPELETGQWLVSEGCGQPDRVIKNRGCFCQAVIAPYFNRGYFHITLRWLEVQCAVASQHSATADAGWEKRAWWEMELKILQPKQWIARAAESLVHETLAPLNWLAMLPLISVQPGFCLMYLFWFMKRSVITVSKHWDTVFSYEQSF